MWPNPQEISDLVTFTEKFIYFFVQWYYVKVKKAAVKLIAS